MTIRKATVGDAEAIAPLILLAMKDIVFGFIGASDYETARAFMLHLVSSSNNQYSYQNCWVGEVEGKVVAVACVYDGARLHELRDPVIRFVKSEFGRNLTLEDETQSGEFYIDSIGVSPEHQGQGMGTKILRFLIAEYVLEKHHTLGLLVEDTNISARELYLKLGFEVIRSSDFAGKKMKHLQCRPVKSI